MTTNRALFNIAVAESILFWEYEPSSKEWIDLNGIRRALEDYLNYYEAIDLLNHMRDFWHLRASVELPFTNDGPWVVRLKKNGGTKEWIDVGDTFEEAAIRASLRVVDVIVDIPSEDL